MRRRLRRGHTGAAYAAALPQTGGRVAEGGAGGGAGALSSGHASAGALLATGTLLKPGAGLGAVGTGLGVLDTLGLGAVGMAVALMPAMSGRPTGV